MGEKETTSLDTLLDNDDAIIDKRSVKLFIIILFGMYAIRMWSHAFDYFLSDFIIKGPFEPKHFLITAMILTFLLLIVVKDFNNNN